MNTIISVIDEILKFSEKVLTVAEGVTEDRITDFEKKNNVKLPNDYKLFLKKINGLSIMGTIVYGLYEAPTHMSLNRAFEIEHYEVENEMPLYLIPFSPDGGGNHYCFDSTKCNSDSCQVVFWQWDLSNSKESPPEIVNTSFVDWAKEVLVDWTLEDYDYDGNRKV